MRGIFYAAGPDVRPGVRLPPLQNVHVYPFVLKLLGLTPPEGIDGRFEVMLPAYKGQ
jgi:alkaline phosphatase D